MVLPALVLRVGPSRLLGLLQGGAAQQQQGPQIGPLDRLFLPLRMLLGGQAPR